MRAINSAGCVSQSSQCLNFMAIAFLFLVLAATTATSSVVGPSRTNPSFSLEDNTIDPSSELLQIQPAEELLYPPESSSFHVIDSNECITITMDEGVFHFKSRGGNQVCGLYFVADPDKIISLTVEYIDVRCDQKGLISIVDGWELNGQVFPSTEDHEKSIQERFTDLCVEPQRIQKLRRNFILSQNAGLIQYRVPTYGQGFSVRVHHINNPRPCNILVQEDLEAVYKLENFGREVNCSLTTLFDAKIRVLQVITGLHGSQVKYPSHSARIHTAELYHKCRKMGLHDYIQIGGSSGLDTSKMEVIEEFCGYHSHPLNRFTTVFCGMTTLRLVSSGKYHNKLVAEVRRAVIEDIESANYICDIPMK